MFEKREHLRRPCHLATGITIIMPRRNRNNGNEDTNQRVDELMKEVQDWKTSLQFTLKEVDELKAHSELSTGCNSNTEDIMQTG